VKRKLKVVIEKKNDGYHAIVPELEGCRASGKTLDEAIAKIKEAVKLYLENPGEDDRA
jgi:predicted RNase H-like HicB family nuclease